MLEHNSSFNNSPSLLDIVCSLIHLVTVYWLEVWPMSAVSLLMYQVREAAGLDTGSRQSAVTRSPREYLELTPCIRGPVCGKSE